VKSHTAYMTFSTPERRAFVRITDDVQAAVDEAGVSEGMVLVSAMHITAGVWVNDDEPGIQADALEWLDKLAPPSWKEPANDVARELLPDPATTATIAAARTTATPTSRTCSSTSRSCCPSPTGGWTSARGRRSSTPSSTGAGASGWSSR
jgi:thiamine phosphate synthase YjbQ (UPF0047 family)